MRTAGLGFCALLSACAAPPPVPTSWTLQTSATAGTALTFHDGSEERLRVACRRKPADLLVVPGGFRVEAGSPPLRIEAGAASLELPTFSAPGPANAIEATGPLTPGATAFIASGAPIRLIYGDQRQAIPAPDPATRKAFLTACQAAMPA